MPIEPVFRIEKDTQLSISCLGMLLYFGTERGINDISSVQPNNSGNYQCKDGLTNSVSNGSLEVIGWFYFFIIFFDN